MSALNRKWQVATFVSILTATESGSFVPVSPSYPEIVDLVDRKYVKKNAKLHNKDGNVAFVAVKGATVVDLLTDLGYTAADSNELSEIISQEVIQAMTQAQAAAAAPQAPQVPQVPQTPAIPVAPALGGEQPAANAVAPAIPATTEVVQPAIPVIPAIAATETQVQPAYASSGDVDLDVVFSSAATKPASNINYDAVVKAKLADPSKTPSIHVAGRKAKDLSGAVKRQAEYYEQHNGITLRARTVGDNDPKGAGTRIFALTVEEAPERKSFGGK